MSVSGQVSVQSGVGTHIVFTVNGAATLGYAQAFAAAVEGVTVQSLDSVSGPALVEPQAVASIEYIVTADGTSATIPSAGYLLDYSAGATTLTGSGFGDNVLAVNTANGGLGSSVVYNDVGGDNVVTFVNGDNFYNGTDALGNDIIVAGAGLDTIDTGIGSSTVYSGVGSATITLNDALPGSGGVAVLGDGTNTVYANGLSDLVFATAANQTILGGTSAASYDLFVVLPDSVGGGGGDLIAAGAGYTTVFDSVGGNSVFGGSGALYFIGGPGTLDTVTNTTNTVVDTIQGGTGTNVLYGGDGTDAIYFADSTAGASGFVAGTGNETLDGSLASKDLTFFGYNSSVEGAGTGVNETMIGGSGNDSFLSGIGNETLTGGAGDNAFFIGNAFNGEGGNVTITDFAASAGNLVGFSGYTADQVQAALDSATTVSGGLQITLSDATTVTFLGINDINSIHVIPTV